MGGRETKTLTTIEKRYLRDIKLLTQMKTMKALQNYFKAVNQQ